jgi:hypothetical protein
MIRSKPVYWAGAFVLYGLCGLALAAEPLSSAGLSDSYVSDLPPSLVICQAATQQPEAGHSAGTGAAPCPIINAPAVTQGLSDNLLVASFIDAPHTLPTMENQNLEAARQFFDTFLFQQGFAAGTTPGINAGAGAAFH